MKSRPLCVVFVAALGGLGTVPHASARQSAADQRLTTWIAAVDSHQPGEKDAAAQAVASWSRDQLLSLVADVKTLVTSSRNRDTRAQLTSATVPEAARRLRARVQKGALLHADVAIAFRTGDHYDLPATGLVSVAVRDGEERGDRFGTAHWEIGRRLLDTLEPDDTARLWYISTSAWLLEYGDWSEALPHLDRARQIFPTDARLLFYSGAVHEIFAAPAVQSVIARRKGASPSPMSLPNREGSAVGLVGPPVTGPLAPAAGYTVGKMSEELERAERFYARALEQDPALAEARIRRACVIGLRGRHGEAAGELSRTAQMDTAPELRYYALMFLGREEQTLGRLEPARAAFDRAGAMYPRAQSPRLALSHLKWLAGDRASALEDLQQVLPLPLALRDDPWWEYHHRYFPPSDEWLRQLRRAIVEDPER